MDKVYNIINIDDSLVSRKYDWFIHAQNIEKRSKSVPSMLGNYCKCISCEYDNFFGIEGVHEKEVNSFRSQNLPGLMHACGNPNEIIGQLLTYVSEFKGQKVAFDMTGFPIPEIYRVTKLLLQSDISQLDIYYTEPLHYQFNSGMYDKYHYQDISGMAFRPCKPIKGFFRSGQNRDEQIVIQIGFDGGLASSVYEQLAADSPEFKEVFIINGMPSYTAKLKDVSLLNNYNPIDEIGIDNIISSSASNPFLNYNTLVDIYGNKRDKTFTICSIGSKPMALGACLFALDYEKGVKIVYPYYTKTKFDLNEKPGQVWRYEIV